MPFTKKTTEFLKRAGSQTSPKWLDQSKKEFESVIQTPLRDLAFHLAHGLTKEARGYKFPLRGFGRLRRPKHKVGRGDPAYRDWVHLQASRPSKSIFDTNPGLYFYLSAKECFAGAGLYDPSSRQIKQIRAWIDNDARPLQRILKQKSFAREFPDGLETDKKLKTFPRLYSSDHKHIEWLRLQAYYVTRSFSRKEVYSSEFPDLVLEAWRQGLKLNTVLEDALSDWNHTLAPEEASEGASDENNDESLETADLWDDRL